jgi:glutaredoxin 3
MEQNGKNGLRMGLPGSAFRITVYTTDPCGRCLKVKDLLRRNDLDFEEVNLAKDPVGRARLVECTGQMTFPQIIVDDRPIGGLQELEDAEREGRLALLIAPVG